MEHLLLADGRTPRAPASDEPGPPPATDPPAACRPTSADLGAPAPGLTPAADPPGQAEPPAHAHPVAWAWALAAAAARSATAATDPDARVRAAAARHAAVGDPALTALADDPDPGVSWLARRAVSGAFSPQRLAARAAPHARSGAPSAQPPYGLRADDVVTRPPPVHAALALCHTRFDVNLGVAVRSAEAAGLREVFLIGRAALFASPARGTQTVLPVRHVADAAALVRAAREGDYQLVVVQQSPDSQPFHQADYPPRPLFVLGAEDEGVPTALRRAADLLVEIPLWGAIDSLNVAACATCVLFHWRASRAD